MGASVKRFLQIGVIFHNDVIKSDNSEPNARLRESADAALI